MEGFLALFIITGYMIWIVPVVFFFIVLALAENEMNVFAAVSVAIFITLFYNSGLIIWPDPWTIAEYFGLYFVAGSVWSIAKWWFFISERAKEFGNLKLEFIKKVNDEINEGINELGEVLEVSIKTTIPEQLEDFFKKFITNSLGASYRHRSESTIKELVIPLASDYKGKITTWILWWPTSLFWTILNDPLVKLANFIYDRFQGIYTRIANAAFANKGL